ncbi:hypothetical protein PL373_05895 [Tenacibaculum maritimum]|nr:hypothetical protein [Tenacibaculum maritimum]MDB0600682.1 hypothetical protein [Tenacibaculum maritimum]MDB0612665.1 hypothetical protein [Tenacibaculum maritimum]
MDYLLVNQTGGFPLTTNILNELQNASAIFNVFGKLAGDYTIISGCEQVGSTIADGVVFFKGELFPFKGGTKISKVRIKEIVESKNFQDGTTKQVVFKRHVEFGTAVEDYLWSDFKKIDPLISLMNRLDSLEKKAAVYTQGGGMVLWNKPANEIPEGWQEVVNWRGRMPVGFNPNESEFNQLGKTGGEKTHRLTIPEMPRHRFGFPPGAGGDNGATRITSGNSDGTQSLENAFTLYLGNDQPHNNLSPYRVVMFIEYIG